MTFPEGVDVASYQPIKFDITGKSFVFIKVTEGIDYVNPKWKNQRDWARSNGLAVCYYHFAKGMKNLAEADHLLATVSDLKPYEAIAFDWEDSDVSNAEKDAWIKYVRTKTGANKIGLYANRDYWFNHDTTNYAGDFLWIADPGVTKGAPRIQHPWVFHQYSTAGGIDHDVANFASVTDLRKWLGYAVVTNKTYDISKPKVGDKIIIGNVEAKVTKIN